MVDYWTVTRVAVPSPHPTSYVSVEAGSRAVIDVAPTAENARLPVLLVPGFMGSKEDFTPIFDALAAAGHRVVGLDLAGQGESDPGAVAQDPASYLPGAMAVDLPQVLTALGIESAHLLGHSYGGLVTRAAVLADPTPWASLTLLCSGPGALQAERRTATDLLRQAAADMPLAELYDVMLSYWESKGDPLPPSGAREFQRSRFAAGPPAGIIGIANGLLDEVDQVAALGAVLRHADLPVNVIYGERDDAWLPSEQDEMAGRLGVTPIVIAGAGHSPAYEAPDVLIDVLRTLWA